MSKANPGAKPHHISDNSYSGVATAALGDMPIAEASILEVGCSSWVALRELIDQGAAYTGLDIRQSNIDKSIASFGGNLPSNVRYLLGAAQDISADQHGKFDLVFVVGLIYHLSIHDTWTVLDAARRMRRRGLFVNTPVWTAERTKVDYYEVDGNIYSGITFRELEDASPQAIKTMDWASYGTSDYPSFAFDRRCFQRFLFNLGFNLVLDAPATNAQGIWRDPGEVMFSSMDWPFMICPGGFHEDEKARPGIFAEIPKEGPHRSVLATDLHAVMDITLKHFTELASRRSITEADVDTVAQMLPVRLLPHVLLALIESPLPRETLIYALRAYLGTSARFGSPHDRAHALVVLLTVARLHGEEQPAIVADLVRGFLEVYFYAYGGSSGRAEPVGLLLSAWAREPNPPLLQTLQKSKLTNVADVWRSSAEEVVRHIAQHVPLGEGANRTDYRG